MFESQTTNPQNQEGKEGVPLYKRVMGPAFHELPPIVRTFHSQTGTHNWIGFSKVTRGTGALARLISNMMGFPVSGANIPTSVLLQSDHSGDTWTRQFDSKSFRSRQWAERRGDSILLMETIGSVTLALSLVVQDQKLRFVPQGWSVLGVRMPNSWMPNGNVSEFEENSHFRFDVQVCLPVIGQIIHYQGSLTQVRDTEAGL